MAYDLSPNVTANQHEVDPVSRIEGHLGVKVETDGAGTILDANAHGNLWRGFENFLLGREINDAITFVQRICGVCPVPHGMTSTFAVDTVLGYSDGHITFKTGTSLDPAKTGAAANIGVPAKALLIRNLVLSAEFLMSSITHFYHLAAPSYVQGPAIPPWTPYFADSYYNAALMGSFSGRTDAQKGVVPLAPSSSAMMVWDAVILSYVKALKIRRMTFEAGALFAGRMPMTSCFVGGGVTNDGTEDLTARVDKFASIIKDVAGFIVKEYVPIAFVLGLLYSEFDNVNNVGLMPSTMGTAVTWLLANPNKNLADVPAAVVKTGKGYGGGLGRFLAWGAFPTLGDKLAIPGGLKTVPGTDPKGIARSNAKDFVVLNKQDVYNVFVKSSATTSVPTNLKEDISHSRYDVASADQAAYSGNGLSSGDNAAYPGAVTRTKPKRVNGYSYMKAPRWDKLACEVGPYARMMVAGLVAAGSTYASTASGTAIQTATGFTMAGFDAYLKTGTTQPGLNPAMLGSDIVTALANANLAWVDAAGAIQGIVRDYLVGLKGGLSTMDRLRSRALESLYIVQLMVGSFATDGNFGAVDGETLVTAGGKTYGGWAAQLHNATGATWSNKTIPAGTSQGWGGTEAPRGALMHQAKITNGKIVAYQCIVPTTWNGSPKDALGHNGAIEMSCVGAPFAGSTSTFKKQDGTTSAGAVGGVEVLRIAQSFDPCIACAIH